MSSFHLPWAFLELLALTVGQSQANLRDGVSCVARKLLVSVYLNSVCAISTVSMPQLFLLISIEILYITTQWLVHQKGFLFSSLLGYIVVNEEATGLYRVHLLLVVLSCHGQKDCFVGGQCRFLPVTFGTGGIVDHTALAQNLLHQPLNLHIYLRVNCSPNYKILFN